MKKANLVENFEKLEIVAWPWTLLFRDKLSIIFTVNLTFSFFYLGFFSREFMIHRTVEEGKAISLTPLHHFHPFHRHLDIFRVITAESSLLSIGSSPNRIGSYTCPKYSHNEAFFFFKVFDLFTALFSCQYLLIDLIWSLFIC